MPKAEILDIDRRSRQRLVTRLPIGVRTQSGGPEFTAHTRDLSTNGIFLYTASRMTEGSDVDLILILPPELTSGEKC
jgi:PilZ domain